MLCRRCMVVMKPGTTYEKKDERNSGNIVHKRFCQCPRCKERIYNNSSNFQEILETMLKHN